MFTVNQQNVGKVLRVTIKKLGVKGSPEQPIIIFNKRSGTKFLKALKLFSNDHRGHFTIR